jgi:K+-transporting ATPase ATPase C chain
MLVHLRASLCLLAATLLLGAVVYPLILFGVGQAFFHDNAEGSLVRDEGNVVGSHLIAQAFTRDQFFWPRPSAAGSGYAASASGASNWGASQVRLRDRVARAIAPLVRYGAGNEKIGHKEGDPIWPDVEAWLKETHPDKPAAVARWAARYPTLAEDWVKTTGDAVKKRWKTEDTAEGFVAQWKHDLPQEHAAWEAKWKEKHEAAAGMADLAGGFFESYAAAHPGVWPVLADEKEAGEGAKKITTANGPDDQGDVLAALFDLWRQEHPDVVLGATSSTEPTTKTRLVPADYVMASGSGLDPHITLANATFQLDRVAHAWATLTNGNEADARKDIADRLEKHARPALGGLAGGDRLVNVLDVNLELKKEYGPRVVTGPAK